MVYRQQAAGLVEVQGNVGAQLTRLLSSFSVSSVMRRNEAASLNRMLFWDSKLMFPVLIIMLSSAENSL